MSRKKVMLVFGTRPEAIKMCPLVLELKKRHTLETVVCVTGQHKEMLKQVLQEFKIVPDVDLCIMKEGQDLFDITIQVLERMRSLLRQEKPDIVLVHGDTTTAFAAALSAFYEGICVGHVEAGLRTYQLDAPWPEEYNRQSIDIASRFRFAPTEEARNNLIQEGKPSEEIYVTGNTGIDALFMNIKKDYADEYTRWAKGSRLLLITAHRRENLGEPMRQMFRAICRILEEFPDVKALYPVHMNPAVRQVADEEFGGHDRIRLIEPLDMVRFQNLMNQSYLILTDSGGIQEEAPALGKPVIVMRKTTERPEGVKAGTLLLGGTKEDSIYSACRELLTDKNRYRAMSQAKNPYGDGTASSQITDILEREFV